MDYQVFPRLAAFAEVAWCGLPEPAERDFAGFERRMAAHYERLDALGVELPSALRAVAVAAAARPAGPAASDVRSTGRPRTV